MSTIDAGFRHPNHFAAMGDSRMAQIFTDSPKKVFSVHHFFNQANARLGQRMKMVVNTAVSGQRSDQYLSPANIAAVAASDARFCMIFGVVNDVGQSLPNGDPFVNFIKPACELLIATGIIPILFTEPGATSIASNATARGQVQRYNGQLRAYVNSRPNGAVLLFDLASIVLDLTSTTIAFKAGYSADGTHQLAPAGVAIGRAFAAFIGPRVPALPVRKVNGSETPATGYQIMANPGFLTATGGTVGSGITGSVPSQINAVCDAGITATTSTADNADGTKDFIFNITATASGRCRGIITHSSSYWTTGDVFDVSGQVEMTANNGAGLSTAMLQSDANYNSTTITSGSLWAGSDADYGLLPADVAGETLDLTHAVTILGTGGYFSTAMVMYFKAAGTATVKWRHIAVDKRQAA